MMAWTRDTATDAEVVLSVCTGAFVLAPAGLLEGQEATTHHASLERLALHFPKVKVRSDRRVVANGKVIVAAGVAAGIDGALHAVARLCGKDAARATSKYRSTTGSRRRPLRRHRRGSPELQMQFPNQHYEGLDPSQRTCLALVTWFVLSRRL
jgi:transcriptional regulator GlxA family with amidase domain